MLDNEGMVGTNKSFIPLHKLAVKLGLPTAWLKAEATANRIPTLRAGRRLMFDLDAVRQALLERAANGEEVRT